VPGSRRIGQSGRGCNRKNGGPTPEVVRV
jgi:hypothetical protein